MFPAAIDAVMISVNKKAFRDSVQLRAEFLFSNELIALLDIPVF